MSRETIGLRIIEHTAALLLETTIRAEAAGIPVAWLSFHDAGNPDPLLTIAAACRRTSRIKFAVAVIPTYTRHPTAMIAQVQALEDLAPGRFRLGIGSSHQGIIEDLWGIPFEHPQPYLRDYVEVLRAAFTTGQVEVENAHFRVRTTIGDPPKVPILISAERRRGFRQAGEISDGLITWTCPAQYLGEVAIPALVAGAAEARRSVPPLIAHCYVALNVDRDEVHRLARQKIRSQRWPYYRDMFADAGYTEFINGDLPDSLIDELVVHGNEDQVVEGLRTFIKKSGASELMVTPLLIGPDQNRELDQVIKLVGSLAG